MGYKSDNCQTKYSFSKISIFPNKTPIKQKKSIPK